MGLKQSIKATLLPPGEVSRVIPLGPARGIRAAIDFRFDTAFYFGFYESELHPYVRKLVGPGRRVFDVGGHRGWEAMVFAKQSRTPVLTFEVNHENREYMQRSFALNDYEIEIDPRYVGDKDDNDSVTIDTAADEYFTPEFIKMDIEGAEAHALRGAERTMAKHKPAWIVEVHGLEIENECLEILRDFHYETTIVDHRQRILKEARGTIHNRWIVAN